MPSPPGSRQTPEPGGWRPRHTATRPHGNTVLRPQSHTAGRPATLSGSRQAREASGRANTSRPAVVCRVLVTLTGTVRPIWSRLPSTTTIVPSSR